jgi:hypothetical protein
VTPTLPIDVRIPGVGRVKKQSGVRSTRERNDLVAMLRLLPKQGYVDLVREIKAGRRALLEVYAHFTAGTLDQLRGPRDDAALWPLAERWCDDAPVAESTRLQRRDTIARLRKLAIGSPTLRDLPALLAEFRATCAARGHATTFNRAKAACQALLRDTIGRHTNAWARVSDVPGLREAKQGRPGLTLSDAIVIRQQLARRSPRAARIWWSMCLTGMGPKELWEDGFQVLDDRIHIGGKKAVGRNRDVPLVDYPTQPELTREGFKSALQRFNTKRARSEWVTPYRARKTFDRWLQDAGIPRARRIPYMGHGRRDVTDRYELYEVEAYLRDDAAAMRGLLGPQRLQMVP